MENQSQMEECAMEAVLPELMPEISRLRSYCFVL